MKFTKEKQKFFKYSTKTEILRKKIEKEIK